jgi:tetratricopeptide (TPR) repeat protein
MRKLAALSLLLTAGCASAPIKKADQASLVVAETRVLEGCYTCLLEAREVFTRVAVGKARPLVVARLFEVNVLIGMREKELAMDGAESFARARALVPELPPTYAGAQYVDIAQLIPPDAMGTPRTELSAFRNGVQPARFAELKAALESNRQALTAGEASAPFRAYLSASLDCLPANVSRPNVTVTPNVPNTSSAIPAGAPPLVKYRLATCPVNRARALEELLATTPSFIEAGVFLARQPTLNITATYVKNMRSWLNKAYEGFPRSPSITYGLGALSQTVGDCKTAIRFYEDTIALKDRHEDAALQRVICLSHLGQFAPAIEAATRIIDRGYYNLPEAFYWRAWNHHRRIELPQARADVDRALALMFNSQVLTLGGMIKYDQDDLVKAEADLKEAVRIDGGQCVAHWYLGLVSFKKAAWPETASRFGASATCYEKSADENVRRLEDMRKADVDPEFKAIQIAGFEAVIKEDRDQQWGSILNAANGYARAEQIETALKWLEKIPADAALRSKADELKKLISGKLQ